jgi:hypothetical protein
LRRRTDDYQLIHPANTTPNKTHSINTKTHSPIRKPFFATIVLFLKCDNCYPTGFSSGLTVYCYILSVIFMGCLTLFFTTLIWDKKPALRRVYQ